MDKRVKLAIGNENERKHILDTNQVTIIGEIVSDFRYSHIAYGEGFYLVDMAVKRTSGIDDTILLMVSERLIDITECHIGELVEVNGQFRSYNIRENNKSKLELFVFVRELQFTDEIPTLENTNEIYLDGFVCKMPIYRKTPHGREITDLLLAVNRSYGKADYIPCIAWGRNARYASSFEIGDRIQLWGRIQSRHYAKKNDNGEIEQHIAYEVSISKLALVE